MAKASRSISTADTSSKAAIATAAAEIHALINSRAQSPTVDELAAIIAKAPAAPSAARHTYLASDWHRALQEYLNASSRAKSDDDHDALDEGLNDVAEAICSEPVRTSDDLIVRAAIAAHLWDGDISNPGCTQTCRRGARRA
jgi:hypothetical protein